MNKYRLITVLSILFLFTPAFSGFCLRPDKDDINQTVSPSPAKSAPVKNRQPAAGQLQAAAGIPQVDVKWDSETGAPSSIRAPKLVAQSHGGIYGLTIKDDTSFAVNAIAALERLSSIYRISDAESEFTFIRLEADDLAYHHVRLSQKYNGLEVVGSELIVHFDASNSIYEVNGRYVPDMRISTIPKIDGKDAAALAQADLAARGNPSGTVVKGPKLVIYALHAEPALAYEMTIFSGPGEEWRYWIDAQTGKVINAFNEVPKALYDRTAAYITGNLLQGEGGTNEGVWGSKIEFVNTNDWSPYYLYYLTPSNLSWYIYNAANSGYQDTNSCAVRTNSSWGTSDSAEFSAAYNFDVVLNYFQTVHNRRSFDGYGQQVYVNVHYPNGQYDNAFYSFTTEKFYFLPPHTYAELAVLDVCAHEFTHGVTHHTCNLVYQGQSGALNESFSDIFGTAVEFYSQPSGTNVYPLRAAGYSDWLLAEDAVYTTQDVAMRDMRNPQRNNLPSYYQGTYWMDPSSTNDNGGVHINCGVQNFFFYLLCDGGLGTNDGQRAYNVAGIGITNAIRVAYRAQTVYAYSGSTYPTIEANWESAATDLNTNWVRSVQAAWYAVGVRNTPPAPPDSGNVPISGDFDGDRLADPGMVDSNYVWRILLSSAGYAEARLNGFSDSGNTNPAPADFDGDRLADPATYKNGSWTVYLSGAGYQKCGPFYFGSVAGATPAPADFDGDAKADPALYLAGNWYLWLSANNYAPAGPFYFPASAGSQPTPADYDGDAKADPATYFRWVDSVGSNGYWSVWLSGASYVGLALQRDITGISYGTAPATGDFDGDRLADPGLYMVTDPIFIINPTYCLWLSGGGYQKFGPYNFP